MSSFLIQMEYESLYICIFKNSLESICSFYGLNMVGAEVSLIAAYMAFNPERVFKAVMTEHLNDFIVTDDFSPPEFIAELIVKKMNSAFEISLFFMFRSSARLSALLLRSQKIFPSCRIWVRLPAGKT